MKANRHDNNLPRRHYGHASRSAASAGSVTGEKVPASRVHTTSSVCPTARDHDCSSPGPLAVPTCGTIRRVSCTNQVPSHRSAIRPLPGKKGRSTVPISDRRASLGYIVTSDRAWSRSPSGPNVSGHPTRSRALCAACCGCTLDRARPRPPCPPAEGEATVAPHGRARDGVARLLARISGAACGPRLREGSLGLTTGRGRPQSSRPSVVARRGRPPRCGRSLYAATSVT